MVAVRTISLEALVTVADYGYGPASIAAQLFPYLHTRIRNLDFAGAGHTVDLQKGLEYRNIIELPDSRAPQNEERLREILPNYQLIISVCDPDAARGGQGAGIPICFVDAIPWFWPKLVMEAHHDLHICQDYFGVKELFSNLPGVVIVPPFSVPPGRARKREGLFINFGGLKNPFNTIDDCVQYAGAVLDAVVPLARRYGRSIAAVSSAGVVDGLPRYQSILCTVTPLEAQKLMSRSELAIVTAGLGNIFDAASLAGKVLFLPPTNPSQGQQLELLLANGISPAFVEWNEIYGKKIDYSASDENDIEKPALVRDITSFIRQAAGNVRFRQALERHITLLLETPSADSSLRILNKLFGSGGLPAAAGHIAEFIRKL